MSNKENARPEPPRPNPRDSHDLSLSPRNVTRDSLVTNMLLSLDQFSMDQFAESKSMGNYDDSNMYSYGNDTGSRSMTATSRARGINNGHGYTYSSDYEGADDSSRISSQPSRGRRSNSSSGFQSSLGRINSMRESSTHQRSGPGTPGALHSRGGKGSKSSSTNSIDAGGYAQVLGSQRWAHGFGGRSSSFDYGHRQSTSSNPPPQQVHQQPQQPSWHIEFSNSFFNEDYDAAPTPTVPGGPRRLQTAPSMPSFPPPQPMIEPKSPVKPSVERKRSTRSSRSATVGRQAQSKFVATRDLPPMPAIDLDSAPAPHVGYEKSKELLQGGIPNSASQVKEKQGFFRRVFGSSKNSLVAALDSSMNTHSNSSFASSASASNSQQNITSPMKSSSSAPPSRESHHSTHVLQKKPSSFFRRRKKSIAEPEPPPLPVPIVRAPVSFPVETAIPPAKPEPSPVTSLRKAMSPFLKGSPTMPNAFVQNGDPSPEEVVEDPLSKDLNRDGNEDDGMEERRVRGFSPDYEPDPKATIRSVQPESRGRDAAGIRNEPKRGVDTPTRQPPEPPKKNPQPSRSGSFLHDNSESEDSPKRVINKPSRSSIAGSRDRSPISASRSSGFLSPNTDKPLPSPSTIRDDATSKASEKILLQNPDEPDLRPTSLTLPIEGAVSDANGSMKSAYKSSTSLPSVKVESSRAESEDPRDAKNDKPIDEPDFVIGDPTEDDRAKAQRIFDGNEDFIQKEKAAAWMGEEGPLRQRTLRAYMDLYDFTDKSVLSALRQICGRLVFRAETQQVDRILVAFSKRWCDCNPNHGFKSTDVIHTICYSIMLLNTDLHLADIESKMTRSQFIKNTMTTVRQAVADSVPDAFDRPSILPSKSQSLGVDGESRPSMDQDRTSSFRASFMPPPRSESRNGMASDGTDDCGPLVKAPFVGTLKAWESQMDIVLKDTYMSIRDERLPLYGAEATPIQSQNSLSVIGMLKRTPSVLSKAPSENSSSRGRGPENAKNNGNRWTSKSRSRPRAFGGTGFSSSRTSFDDGNSVWSPAESSATWSRASLGRTHTSMSMDSFGSSWPRGDFHQSIGFANALSQAIIRDDALGSSQSLVSDELKNAQLLEDESLELAGPPWVKEGIVIHKHHLDGIDKKAKDRNWSEVFAVIQKGQLSIFSFSPNKSLGRSKARAARNAQPVQKGAVVGGGNWQENATNLGTFNLRQTLASALPPPGYSRQRPNVWALSLPTGAVHLFQVGTPEISKEFVTTANYWSARLSTHPLVGGISNIEYGWSEAIVNNSLVSAINESTSSVPGTKGGSRPGSSAAGAIGSSSINNGRTSMHSRGSSFRSVGSFDFGSSGQTSSSGRGKLPGDRAHIAEWTPPTQSMRPSNSPEKEQLQTLLAYVRSIEEELQQHNALRSPMLLAFTPRGHHAAKAMANWERKSSYLLREIVKFRTYVDCLQQAETRKGEIWQEREIARRAARGEGGESLELDRTGQGLDVEGSDDDADETLRP